MSAARRIKVLHVIDEFRHAQAGTERQLLHLLEHLDRTRFEPEVAVLRPTSFTESGQLPCPVRTWNIRKIARPETLLRMRRLARQAAADGVTVANLYFNDTAVLAPWFLKHAGIAVISSRRDMGFWRTAATQRLLRFNARYTDALIANSQAVLDDACRVEGIAPERGCVIENALLRTAAAAAPAELPKPLQGRVIVGIVANVRPVKRVHDLVRAFARVSARLPNAALLVVGGGDLVPLEGLARELGVREAIHFTGPVSDALPWIHRFDVAVLCSASEGLSNAVMEYMACGRATVATRTGGNPTLVRDGETGFLVEVGDIDALADRVITLLEQSDMARRFGDRARRDAEARFDAASMVQAHAALYERLAAA